METALQYEIPALHPIAVHFPLALLLAAALVAVLWMIGGRAFWRSCTLVLLLLGTAGAAFAYFTGEAMEEQAEGAPMVDLLVDLHETMAEVTLIGALVVLAALGGATVYLDRRLDPVDPKGWRLGLGLLVVAVAALVAWTAHLGGLMVWGVPAG